MNNRIISQSESWFIRQKNRPLDKTKLRATIITMIQLVQ